MAHKTEDTAQEVAQEVVTVQEVEQEAVTVQEAVKTAASNLDSRELVTNSCVAMVTT